jgi:hypothetical protein
MYLFWADLAQFMKCEPFMTRISVIISMIVCYSLTTCQDMTFRARCCSRTLYRVSENKL